MDRRSNGNPVYSRQWVGGSSSTGSSSPARSPAHPLSRASGLATIKRSQNVAGKSAAVRRAKVMASQTDDDDEDEDDLGFRYSAPPPPLPSAYSNNVNNRTTGPAISSGCSNNVNNRTTGPAISSGVNRSPSPAVGPEHTSTTLSSTTLSSTPAGGPYMSVRSTTWVPSSISVPSISVPAAIPHTSTTLRSTPAGGPYMWVPAPILHTSTALCSTQAGGPYMSIPAPIPHTSTTLRFTPAAPIPHTSTTLSFTPAGGPCMSIPAPIPHTSTTLSFTGGPYMSVPAPIPHTSTTLPSTPAGGPYMSVPAPVPHTSTTLSSTPAGGYMSVRSTTLVSPSRSSLKVPAPIPHTSTTLRSTSTGRPSMSVRSKTLVPPSRSSLKAPVSIPPIEPHMNRITKGGRKRVGENAPSMPEKVGSPIVIDLCSSSSSEDEGTPPRLIFCLKKEVDMEKFEQSEDCFILDFNPFESIDLSKLSVSKDREGNDHLDDSDLTVIAEKGMVACRDYPHSRHLCVKFSFDSTPHDNYCEKCYCYVCDMPAPCQYWIDPQPGHCHATENVGNWKLQRLTRKQQQSQKG